MLHRKDILEREDDVKNWVLQERSKAYICRKLNCRPSTLEKYLNIFGIEYAGNQGGRGKSAWNKKPVKYYLKNVDSVIIGSHVLKLKLYQEGLKKPCCEKCGIIEWEGQVLSFHLDHINGNRFDNRLENLRILCPNCHSQTPTYAAKGMSKFKKRVE